MKKSWWFGRSCQVDLHECDISLIKPVTIRKYVREVTELLDMKRHGPTRIGRFGTGRLRGYSMTQFIETSSITGHFDDKGHRAFIDVFSCKHFNAKKVGAFTKKFFNAKRCKVSAKERL